MDDKKTKKKSPAFKGIMVIIGALAIIAAIVIPAVLVSMDKAKEKQCLIDAKSAYTAAQSVAGTMFLKGEDPSEITSQAHIAEIVKLAGLDGTGCTSFKIGFKDLSYSKDKDPSEQHDCYYIQYVQYGEDGHMVSFNGTDWENFSSPVSDLLVIR